MKFTVVIFMAVVFASAEINDEQENKEINQNEEEYYGIYKRYAPHYLVSDRNAELIKFEKDIKPDGSYYYNYETSNGISASEKGSPRDLGGKVLKDSNVVEGSFSWTSPEGIPVDISYIADENGYQAFGNAIPTPSPQLLRALTYIAKNINKK